MRPTVDIYSWCLWLLWIGKKWTNHHLSNWFSDRTGLFFVLQNGLQLLEEDFGVLRLEDERGPEPDRSLPATAAVDAGDTQLRHDAVTSTKQNCFRSLCLIYCLTLLTLFLLFSSFSHHNLNIIWKSINIVLKIRTRGRSCRQMQCTMATNCLHKIIFTLMPNIEFYYLDD